MDLPKHIANMCGIKISGPEPQAPNQNFQAIDASKDADVMTIRYRGEVVGWISDIAGVERGPKYRALTANGRIDRFYTQSQAMSWLIEESF